MALRRFMRDRVNVHRKVMVKDSETRELKNTYPSITHEKVPCSVQIGGRVGAREALMQTTTGQYVNSPARIFLRVGQKDGNGTEVEILVGDKVEQTVRDRKTLSAGKKARATFIALEDAPSPVKTKLVRVSLGTEEGTDR